MMIFNIYFSTSAVLKLGRQAHFEHTFDVSCVFWHLASHMRAHKRKMHAAMNTHADWFWYWSSVPERVCVQGRLIALRVALKAGGLARLRHISLLFLLIWSWQSKSSVIERANTKTNALVNWDKRAQVSHSLMKNVIRYICSHKHSTGQIAHG